MICWKIAGAGALLFLAVAPLASAQTNNVCDMAGESPDVIVGDIQGTFRHGVAGGITAFSIGMAACNTGSCWLNWIANSPAHPVIGANMFRLKNGRFEQIGQSWLKHGFGAASETLCSPNCIPSDGMHLGVNCSDPYLARQNGTQSGLGPKFEVNPTTGVFPYPPTNGSLTGNAIYKRLQVHNADLDPALNTGAQYFVEGQYVTADDAAAGNQNNNASYRPITVSGNAPTFNISLTGATASTKAGIEAWKTIDPAVVQTDINVNSDGRYILAATWTSLGGGLYHYEYALQNLNSYRAAGSFSVPIPSGAHITNAGFHDVDYHSGEPFDGTDWTATVGASSVVWSTTPYATNVNANALRWGTLYNFRFDADVQPATHTVTIGLFRPGSPASVTATMCVPNGICEPGETPCQCAVDCGAPHAREFPCTGGADEDCDGLVDCADPDCCTDPACPGNDADGDGVHSCENDCDDANGLVWATPGEARNLWITKTDTGGSILLGWDPPANTGGTAWTYDLLRSENPGEFFNVASCLLCAVPLAPACADGTNPGVSGVFYYLVRAHNACPSGDGIITIDSNGTPRGGRSCR